MYSLVKAGKPKWRIQQQLRLNARPSTLTWYERWLARNLESDTFFSPPGLQNGQQPHWFRRSYVLQNSSDGSLKAWRTSLPEQDQDSPNGNRTVGTRAESRPQPVTSAWGHFLCLCFSLVIGTFLCRNYFEASCVVCMGGCLAGGIRELVVVARGEWIGWRPRAVAVQKLQNVALASALIILTSLVYGLSLIFPGKLFYPLFDLPVTAHTAHANVFWLQVWEHVAPMLIDLAQCSVVYSMLAIVVRYVASAVAEWKWKRGQAMRLKLEMHAPVDQIENVATSAESLNKEFELLYAVFSGCMKVAVYTDGEMSIYNLTENLRQRLRKRLRASISSRVKDALYQHQLVAKFVERSVEEENASSRDFTPLRTYAL